MRAARLLRWRMFLSAALFILSFVSLGGARGISSNDPFRAISLTVTKPESPPVCSLKALTPLEPLDDEVLLSFEEWKKKQAAHQEDTGGSNQSLAVANGNASNANGTRNVVASPDSNVSIGYSLQASDVAPHFRVPITDRFDYANIDCSARVHTSHRSAKSPSSILSSKKDRYMLSPCNSGRENQFVVVELCDDIRIDTVQMANFEFFSGVFKDFSVSVAKTYSIDPDGWTFAGTYRAKNVRGVQSFHPPTSLRDFYRFIRIDFLSHYGNEYYCPISLLRVYGLTHLEEWKWDTWQAESRAKLEKGTVPAVQVVSISPPLEDVSTSSTGTSDGKAPHSVTEATTIAAAAPQETDPTTTIAGATTSTSILSAATTQSSVTADSHDHESDGLQSTIVIESSSASSGSSQSSSSQTSVKSPTSTHISSSASLSSHSSVPEIHPKSHERIASSSNTHQSQVQSSTISIPSSTIIPSHSSILPSPQSPVPPTGESIYRTIMNRLTATENNQTLYMKYVEQQNGAMRDVIRRLGEDVGRLEGITRAQGMVLQKTVNDWEKQRYQLQMEYKDILRRMEILSHDIILEKRLGVAQLCLLLAVLIFLGLTRGSRGNEPVEMGQASSRTFKTGGLREWGRRHLSWTADRSGSGGKSSETPDLDGWKKGNDGRNRGHDRMREKSNTKTPTKRPKPLVLGPSNVHNILRAYADPAENSKPFPSSEPPLTHTTIGTTMNRPRRRTISQSHTRSRTGSGSATSVHSAPLGPGISRRMIFQRPVTPTPRSHLAFRTPQSVQRSHSVSRSTTPIGSAGGPVRGPIPLPMSQTSSWGGPLAVIPKSAKNWARTAHLHDVKSVKKRLEQGRTESKGKSERGVATDVEEDDVFFWPLTKQPSASLALDDAPVLSTQRSSPFGVAQDFNSLHQNIGSEPSTDVALTEDESDPWVDTDSASADDGNPDSTFEFSFPKSVVRT